MSPTDVEPRRPKGSKGRQPDLEHETGAVHAAEAASLFRSEVNRVLPRDAFLELEHLTPEGVGAWAERWRVQVPLVVEAARALAGSPFDGIYEDLGDGYRGPERPDAWHAQLAVFNRLPVEPACRVDIMSEAEAREELAKLIKGSRTDPTRVERERYLKTQLPADRARFLERNRASALAPIGADPVAESLESFLNRSRNHWTARVLRARKLGFISVTTKAELRRDIQWLVRYHVQGHSAPQIASTSSPVVTAAAVNRAVQRAAALLGLTLRAPSRGKRASRKTNKSPSPRLSI